MAYRRRFCHDVVVDLVGYRRFGHNEQDEAAYTQPVMVQQIQQHPPVRELYAQRLVAAGVLTQEDADELLAAAHAQVREAHERLKASFGQSVPSKAKEPGTPAPATEVVVTAVPAD